MKISLSDARKIAIESQLLNDTTSHATGKNRIKEILDHLGYIQIDTISVVQRAHHHTIWSRCPSYQTDMIYEMQSSDRSVFEYWGHGASFLPIQDYRFYQLLMKQYFDPKNKWVKNRFEKYGHLLEPILQRIREEGALSSSDFKKKRNRKSEGWWDWKPAKVVLELLFWRGDLMITRRDNFQKVYDLTERVLPDHIDTTMPTDEEVAWFLIKRALNAHGIARKRTIRDHIRTPKKKSIINQLKKMVKNDDVIEVTIDTLEDKTYYALNNGIIDYLDATLSEDTLHILSPFDNFVIHRDRIEKIFGFDFALECYLPKKKRQYGYFSLPIFWKDRFIGRMDSKADRKKKNLIVKNLVFEDDFNDFDRILSLFHEKLQSFATFNESTTISIQKTSPKKVKSTLQEVIDK